MKKATIICDYFGGKYICGTELSGGIAWIFMILPDGLKIAFRSTEPIARLKLNFKRLVDIFDKREE